MNLQNINPKNIWKKLNLNKPKIIGISVACVIIILSFIFLRDNEIFYFILGISFVIGLLPFFISLILETSATREKEEMFLEFSRNLAENVRAGTPIGRSILNVRKKDYGKLDPYVDKLANQVSLGIPVQAAFETFARDAKSKTISRTVTIISEAEKAGGKIDAILEAVVKSITQTEKLRKERRAIMYSLVVQGYIIFLVFIIIILVMQFKILPIASGLGEGLAGAEGMGSFSLPGSTGQIATTEQLTRPFLWLLIIQGFFAGLVVGKLAEGKIKFGLKHSFILITMALLISTGARVFFG